MQDKAGGSEVIGCTYSVPELIKEIEKDQIFYDQSGGGVTLSGGEPMSQHIDYIEELVIQLHQRGIHVAIDTCGYVDFKHFKRILPFVSLFLYDVKFINRQKHIQYTGVDNKRILENLEKLSQQKTNLYLRCIILDEVTSDDDINSLIKWLIEKKIIPEVINLLPYHHFGKDKYRRLQRPIQEHAFLEPSSKTLEAIKKLFEQSGFQAIIGGTNKINKETV